MQAQRRGAGEDVARLAGVDQHRPELFAALGFDQSPPGLTMVAAAPKPGTGGGVNHRGIVGVDGDGVNMGVRRQIAQRPRVAVRRAAVQAADVATGPSWRQT